MKIITITIQSTNCYLISAKDGWIMIDTGWPDTLPLLLQQLKSNDISVNEINHLIITHFHPDHAGLTQNLRDLGTNLLLLDTQIPYMGKLNNFFKKNPKANFRDIVLKNCTVLSPMESRDYLKQIDIDGQLLPTPGHSEDSISLLIDGIGAFTGDLPALSLMDAYDDPIIFGSWDTIRQHHVPMIYPAHELPYRID